MKQWDSSVTFCLFFCRSEEMAGRIILIGTLIQGFILFKMNELFESRFKL